MQIVDLVIYHDLNFLWSTDVIANEGKNDVLPTPEGSVVFDCCKIWCILFPYEVSYSSMLWMYTFSGWNLPRYTKLFLTFFTTFVTFVPYNWNETLVVSKTCSWHFIKTPKSFKQHFHKIWSNKVKTNSFVIATDQRALVCVELQEKGKLTFAVIWC